MVVVVVVVVVVVFAGIAGNCWYFLVFAGPLLRYRFRYRCQVVLLTRD